MRDESIRTNRFNDPDITSSTVPVLSNGVKVRDYIIKEDCFTAMNDTQKYIERWG